MRWTGTVGMDNARGLGYKRCGFRSGLCYLEVGDWGLSLIFHFRYMGVIVPYWTPRLIISIFWDSVSENHTDCYCSPSPTTFTPCRPFRHFISGSRLYSPSQLAFLYFPSFLVKRNQGLQLCGEGKTRVVQVYRDRLSVWESVWRCLPLSAVCYLTAL